MPDSLDKRLALADVYAQSLFELAHAQGLADEVRGELEQLAAAAETSPEVAAFWESVALDSDRRAELLERMFRGKLSDLTLNTLQVANANERVGMLKALLRCFVLRQEAAANQVEAVATSAVELDTAQRHAVIETAARLSGMTPLVDFRVDPTLLGGLILQIGDVRYDNSVRRHLSVAAGLLRERSERGFESIGSASGR